MVRCHLKKCTTFLLPALLLAFLLIFPVKAQAASHDEATGFSYEVHDGNATITGCTLENNFFMDIPATVGGYPVVSIGASAFQNCNNLIEVTIPEGVVTIEPFAFYECYNLRWLTLPNSLISIGEKAFCACKSLEFFEFGDNLKTIGDGAFSFCENLYFYLEFPEGLESIGMGAFYDCDTLTTVLLPDSLLDLGSKSFALCDNLDYIYIPDGIPRIGSKVLYLSACYCYGGNWSGDVFYMGPYLMDASKSISGSYETLKGITNIADGAFENCNNLTEVILPEGLQIIGAGAFDDCDNLKNVNIPSSVTFIGDKAFYECAALSQVQIPDSIVHLGQDVFTKTGYYNNPENWENNAFYVGDHLVSCKPSLSGAFQVRQGTKTIVNSAMMGAKNLTDLTLPDSLTTIGEKAFYGCTKLKTVHLGKDLSQIGDGAFGQCSNLETITVSNENKTYRSQNNCLIRIQDKCLVMGCKTSQIPQDGSVTSIGAYAFEGCIGLTKVTIPDTVLTIGDGAFRDCNALTTVSLGNGVQVVGKRAFEECDELSNIDLGQNVHTIDDYGFAYNHKIKHVNFPASLRYLGQEAFSNATGLESVNFQEGLLSIGINCFTFCENLESLHLPNSLEEIKDGAFYSCVKIENLSLGKNLTTIGDAAFMGCEALTTVKIPDRVQMIGSSAFCECINLRSVDLGRVQEIGHSAFEFCGNLTQIHIPSSVKKMGRSVFAYCPSMEQMTVSQQNLYYFSQGNCIINTAGRYLAFGCKNSIIPTDGSVTVIDAYAFAGCSTLKRITVPTQIKKIYAYAFLDCSGLQEMYLPFIGDGSSAGDNYLGFIFGASVPSLNDGFVPYSLKQVVIMGGTSVGDSAFINCRGLQEIIFPETVTSIGYSAFKNCTSLQKVVFPGDLENAKETNIFATAPNAWLYISKGQEKTKAFAQNNNIRHQVGGLISFLDEKGQCIDNRWYSYNAQIVTPNVPEKPADENRTYSITWDPIPGSCTGNQTIQLRYVSHWIGGNVQGDFTGDHEVNNRDVEFLLWHTLFPDNYPIETNADFNHDNQVNNLDVEYLLWHTLFPETYPV